MGVGPSYRHVYHDVVSVAKWQKDFEALHLAEADVGKMYKIYRKIDDDNSGTIQVIELLNFLDIERTRFTERVFSIFDEDDSGYIDFREFAVALWNYCTLGSATLSLFAFDLYDKDNSGCIDSSEIGLMLREVYGKNYEKNKHAARIADKIQTLQADVDKDIFREFLRKHPALLFPAFEMQRIIKKQCLGKSFWKRISQRRVELSKGHFLSLSDIRELMHRNNLDTQVRDEVKIDVEYLHKNTGQISKRKQNSLGNMKMGDVNLGDRQSSGLGGRRKTTGELFEHKLAAQSSDNRRHSVDVGTLQKKRSHNGQNGMLSASGSRDGHDVHPLERKGTMPKLVSPDKSGSSSNLVKQNSKMASSSRIHPTGTNEKTPSISGLYKAHKESPDTMERKGSAAVMTLPQLTETMESHKNDTGTRERYRRFSAPSALTIESKLPRVEGKESPKKDSKRSHALRITSYSITLMDQFDAHSILQKLRSSRGVPPRQNHAAHPPSQPLPPPPPMSSSEPQRLTKNEHSRMVNELEEQVRLMSRDMAQLVAENRKLQEENEELLHLMSEQKHKHDDTVAKLRNQVAVLYAKLQNKITHRDKVSNTYKNKKTVNKLFSPPAGTAAASALRPHGDLSSTAESHQANGGASVAGSVTGSYAGPTFSELMRRVAPTTTTPQDFTSQLRHHEHHEAENTGSGPAMSTLFRNIEDDMISDESDVPVIEISL